MLLPGHPHVVAVVHVEIDARNPAFDFISRLCQTTFEIDFEIAGAVLFGRRRQHAEIVIATIGVDFADRWRQIVKIGFHRVEDRIGGVAVLPAAVLPALPGTAEVGGWYDMLPLGPDCPILLRPDLVTAGFVVDATARTASPLPIAAAIEGTRLGSVVVDVLPGFGFGLIESLRSRESLES